MLLVCSVHHSVGGGGGERERERERERQEMEAHNDGEASQNKWGVGSVFCFPIFSALLRCCKYCNRTIYVPFNFWNF